MAQDPQPGASGIIYGRHHAFSVTAPAGWVLDNQAGQRDGLVAVFYPVGGSWRNSQAVMYGNGLEPDSGRPANRDAVIRDDSLRFTQDDPGVRITRSPPLRTSDGRTAEIRRFAGGARGNYEAVAYIAEATVTPMIVLSARSEAAFDEAYPAFLELVRSYSFVTSDVRTKPH